VVGDRAPGGRIQLGGSDIEVAVDLEGIAVYDFSIEFRGNGQGQVAFSGARGAHYRNQGEFRHVCGNRSEMASLLLVQRH